MGQSSLQYQLPITYMRPEVLDYLRGILLDEVNMMAA